MTSTLLRVLEHHKDTIHLAVLGNHHLPPDVRTIGFWECAKLCRHPLPCGRFRIFHARRNNEMLQALALKKIFGSKIKIVFTSTAQRRHTWITRWLIRQADSLVTTCSAAASYLKRDPDAIIPHGIDPNIYNPPEDGKARAWERLGFPGKYGIGIFGRVRPQKGIDILVDAIIPILNEDPSPTVLIVGETTNSHQQYLKNIKEKVRSKGLEERIIFLGKQSFDKIPKLLQGMSLVAALSRNEGYGLTILEAMASGCAVIASRAGAWEDIIETESQGTLVPCDDVTETRKALLRLTQNESLLLRMGKEGRSRVTEKYGIKGEAERLFELYRTL